MATPKVVTDASSDLDEAVLNLFLSVPKLQVKVNYLRVLFAAAGNTVTVDSFDSDGEVVDGDLAWNGGSTKIDCTISGFTVKPIVLITPGTNASANADSIVASASTTSNIEIYFRDATGGRGSNVDPDGDVSFNMFIIGV